MFATEVRLMSEFTVGEPVTDRQDHSEIGHIDDLRADGWLGVIWTSGRHEWVHDSTVMLAPGYKPKKRPKPT